MGGESNAVVSGGFDAGRLRYGVFGGLTIFDRGGSVRVAAAKQRSLLARLLIRANATVGVDELVDELWPVDPPRTARNVLQWYVSQLRRTLPADAGPLAWDTYGYRITVAPGELDATEFARWIADGRASLADRDYPAARAQLGNAMNMWHAAPYGDVASSAAIDAEVARLTQLRHVGLVARLRADLVLGDGAAIIGELTTLAAAHPFDEEVNGLLIEALYGLGRAADALGHCRQLRRTLCDELGLDPGPWLSELEHTILNRRPLEPGPGVPGRGEPDPPEIGIRTPPRPQPPRPFQLPPDLPDFVGRAGAGETLVRMLGDHPDGAYPAVAAITGDPGIGKSALAVHVAHRVAGNFPDGAMYIDLLGGETRPVDPADALGQLLVGFGVPMPSVPPQAGARSSMLRSLLAGKRVLLVLDNVAGAEQVRALLPGSSSCAVLITSRAPMPGIGPHPAVELYRLSAAESTDLLRRVVGQARTAREPAETARVVALLDGLPLALRVVGSRLAGHPHRGFAWVARRLGDERRRLQVLNGPDAAVTRGLDLSYQAISPEQRAAMRLLAALEVPDFAAWLAGAVLDRPAADIEDTIDALVQARLLSVAPTARAGLPRYRFHQLVRWYARQLSSRADQAAVREAALRRAYTACLTVAEEMDLRLRRTPRLAYSRSPRRPLAGLLRDLDVGEPLRWFEAERATLVAAVLHAAAHGWDPLAWDLALSLSRFCQLHNHIEDWRTTGIVAVAATRRGHDPAGLAAARHNLGEFYSVQDRHRPALRHLSRAAELFREHGDRRGEGWALAAFGVCERSLGRRDAARVSAERSLALLSGHRAPADEAVAWHSLGAVHYEQGRVGEAAGCYVEALRRYGQVGDSLNEAILHCDLGIAYGALGRSDEAEAALDTAVRRSRQVGFGNGEVYGTVALGQLQMRTGRDDRAIATLHQGLALARRIADAYAEGMSLLLLGTAYRTCGRLPESGTHLAGAEAVFRRLDMPGPLARALVGRGDTAAAAGTPDEAAAAWREALDILQGLGAPDAVPLAARLAEVS
ncbi:AfsR/SARP family transcriptional regulator [Jidongwangia harbinensis]|uniref:AfsR/SARP family transcriptional regulator n=1 Tax=Jidongwangia harbinensis TaxID=2878561 RepID=UPI001CDA0FCB|nr:BTAD domain-containing putative transcriptional regulator [Jidongwangia harbinensis]MCA2211613.1 tetratricopeptide repeat protein [Jidongwangia harbinensis]